MKDAGVKPDEIPYINAHGTATHLNDLFETRAIRLAFGEHATKLKIKDVYKRQVLSGSSNKGR